MQREIHAYADITMGKKKLKLKFKQRTARIDEKV